MLEDKVVYMLCRHEDDFLLCQGKCVNGDDGVRNARYFGYIIDEFV